MPRETVQVRVEQKGTEWLVQVIDHGQVQEFTCATELMAVQFSTMLLRAQRKPARAA